MTDDITDIALFECGSTELLLAEKVEDSLDALRLLLFHCHCLDLPRWNRLYEDERVPVIVEAVVERERDRVPVLVMLDGVAETDRVRLE